MFYNTAYFEDINSIDEKSRLTELVVNKFINVAMNIQDNFANIKRIDFNSLYYIVSACRSIINYYRFTEFDATTSTKVPLMNNAIKSFSENIEYLKVIDLKTNNVASNLEWTTVSGNTKHAFEHNEIFRRQVLNNSIKAAKKTILPLEVKDRDGFLIGVFHGYQEAATALGINEKTVRNIRMGKFETNRNGYFITAVEKGGDAV